MPATIELPPMPFATVAVAQPPTDAGADSLQNYEIQFSGFGPFHGFQSVIPTWWLNLHRHNIPKMVDQGLLKPTNRPVTAPDKLFQPKVNDPAIADAQAVETKLSKLQTALESTQAQAKQQAEALAEVQRQQAAKDKALGAQTAELDRLRTLLEAEQAARKAAESELETLTAPPVKAQQLPA